MDQSAVLEQGSEGSKRTRPTHGDVKPALPIPLIQPRRDITKELEVRGLSTGLTSWQPQVNLDEERVQTMAELIFHPHLQGCGEGLGYELYIEQRRLLFLLWECLLTRHNEFMYGMIGCCVICGLRAK